LELRRFLPPQREQPFSQFLVEELVELEKYTQNLGEIGKSKKRLITFRKPYGIWRFPSSLNLKKKSCSEGGIQTFRRATARLRRRRFRPEAPQIPRTTDRPIAIFNVVARTVSTETANSPNSTDASSVRAVRRPASNGRQSLQFFSARRTIDETGQAGAETSEFECKHVFGFSQRLRRPARPDNPIRERLIY